MIRIRSGGEEKVMSLLEFEQAARCGELSPFAWVQNSTLTGSSFRQARDIPLFVSLYDPSRLHFQRHFQLARVPIVTAVVTGLCALLFWWAAQRAQGMPTREALLALGAKSGAHILEAGESWRLLVANFLHRDATHLALNLFGLTIAGAVIEGVYRRGDYVLLLVCAGVSTMALSAWWSDAVTVGASGLVFGCLGATLAFTLRYGRWLPHRYRLYFGFAAILYAFGMLAVGFLSPRTDNVGHVGGLLCGVLLGNLLVPRLLRLRTVAEAGAELARPWLAAALVAVLITLPLGAVLRHASLADDTLRLGRHGVTWTKPASWRKRVESVGFVTWGNGVDAFASFGCTRRDRASPDGDLHRREMPERAVSSIASGALQQDDLLRLEEQLAALAREPTIRRVHLGAWSPVTMGPPSAPVAAMRMPLRCDTDEGPLAAEAWVFAHGHIECTALLASYPSATPRARAALAAIPGSLRIEGAQHLHADPRQPLETPPARAHPRP